MLALLAGCPGRSQRVVQPPEVVPSVEVTTTPSSWTASFVPSSDAPAIRLTASDGTGLALVAVQARVWIEAPLALTELHLTFENQRDRTIEGNFAVQLPPRAAVSRFAMKIGELWQEGEVIERRAAQRIFEDFLHRRQDPALLELDAGEQFKARVFPIPARARKQLVVTYSQELAGSHASYRLPLAGLPRLESLDVRVLGPDPARPDGAIELFATRERAVGSDLVLHEQGGPRDGGLRSGTIVTARVVIPGAEAEVTAPTAVTLLFDTSASQAGHFADKVAGLAALIDRLAAVHGADLPVRVVCFDQDTSALHVGPAGGFVRMHVDAIVQRRAAGASDLGRALAAIRGGVRRGEHVVIVGDGVATAGHLDGGALYKVVRTLVKAGVTRVDGVLVGGNRDTAMMTRLATAGAEHGIVVDGATSPDAIVSKLGRPTFTSVPVRVLGSTWSWPETLGAVQPGDSVLIHADLPETHLLHVELGGLRSLWIEPRTAARPLLERALVGARIDRLVALRDLLPESDVNWRDQLRAEVVDLSRKFRVLSPYTGLLVLETEADYRRYGIDRATLSDILAVGDHGPQLLRRHHGELVVAADRSGAVDLAADPTATPDRTADEDGDTVFDRDDRCPSVPETRNGYEDMDGCPDELPRSVAAFTGMLRGIHFERDSAKIRPDSRRFLDDAVRTLQDFSEIRIEVNGHCSADEKDLDLGRRRAAVVAEYLVQHGIVASRVMIRNGRADEPVADNNTKRGLAVNRRIEFRILTDMKWPNSWEAQPLDGSPYTGPLAEVMAAIPRDPGVAVELATKWCDREPGDVLAWIALGDALAAAGDRRAAARAYGSILDLFPSRTDLRRHAGQRLAALGDAGIGLAIDTYARAVEQRPDHPSGHRLLAYALASGGRHREAFAAILAGMRATPSRTRSKVEQVLWADAGILAAALVAREPAQRAEVEAQIKAVHLSVSRQASTRFVLSWETDANDVDLHVIDASGVRANYAASALPSGGALENDVTNGYGPEVFVLPGPAPASPYTIEAHYSVQGAMGPAMGTVQVVEHDGKGTLKIEERPFVLMHEGARVSLGEFTPRAG